MIEKASGKKGVIPIIAALGIVCIVLLASLVGAVVRIASLDSQVSNLQNQVSELSSTPMLQPVQFTGALQLADGTLANGMTYFFVVPNETRLVIEFVSARIYNLDPSDSIDLYIVTWVNDTRVEHYLGVAGPEGRPKIDPYSQAYQFISQEVQIYADAGSHVSVGANRVTRINTATVIFSISGYFVDVP
jgi:uncharacterized cupredoxin-like copper-binding protein